MSTNRKYVVISINTLNWCASTAILLPFFKDRTYVEYLLKNKEEKKKRLGRKGAICNLRAALKYKKSYRSSREFAKNGGSDHPSRFVHALQ